MQIKKFKNMTEKELNQQESLQLIDQMIKRAKKNASDSSFYFLIWGILVIAASITQFLMLINGMDYESNWVWAGMVLIGLPITFIYEWKRGKRQKTITYNDRLNSILWLAFGISLMVIIFIAVYNQTDPIPFILVLVGLATFITGVMIRFRPLIFGGILFWVSSVVSVFISGPDILLLNAVAIFLGYIIPGILLNRKTNKESHV